MSTLTPTSLPHAQPLIADGETAKKNQADAGGGFFDFLDFINPLQHIPVVSTLYRAATGDEISAVARIVGGGIFGGIPGLVSSVANTALDAATGKDAGEMALAALEEITTASAQTPEPSVLDDGVALNADKGEALVSVAAALPAVPAPSAAVAEAAVAAQAAILPGGLNGYRDPSLGLKDERKAEQLSSSLHEIALKM